MQSASLLLQPNTYNFTVFCHWLGQGLLFGMVGSVGLVAEFHWEWKLASQGLKAVMQVMTHRLLLAFYYFVIGCCALGGLRRNVATIDARNRQYTILDSTVSLRFFEMVIGSVAWFAAAFNLLTSCCFGVDREADADIDEEKAPLVQAGRDTKSPFNSWSRQEAADAASSARSTTASTPTASTRPSMASSARSTQASVGSLMGTTNWNTAASSGSPMPNCSLLPNGSQELAEKSSEDVHDPMTPSGGWGFSPDMKPFGTI